MVYPDNFENKIGFDRIRKLLSEYCISRMGLEKVENISFLTDLQFLTDELSATYEMQQILTIEDHFPSEDYFRISDTLNKIRIEGTFPEVQEVFDLRRSIETVRDILNFFKRRESDRYPVLKSRCSPVKMYPYVSDAIDRIIDKKGIIKDTASPRLKEIRSEIASKNMQAARRLAAIMKQAQAEGIVDSDIAVSIRNGRGVIPVNVYDKRKIRGLIHDQSASGKTVFIEPEEIVEINNDIVELEYEERREIVRILTSLADNIRPYIDDLVQCDSFLGEMDFTRAKATLGNRLQCIKPALADRPSVLWRKASHPLLTLAFEKTPARKVVPLDIELNDNNRILLISGPNAGGKSVCLKTVGLIQYMFQCGMTVPVHEGTEMGIFEKILIDIGDEQSIENDLSTYSSHLLNMKFFLRNGNDNSLILIDEFGTGTEPMLGGAIAEAILAELNSRKVYGVITTHYTNLKHFASLTDGIVNGAMAFDNHLMQPLFQLYIGKPGSSFAFEIARKIGLPENILSGASEKAGVKNIDYDKNLRDIARDKRYWETKRQNIRQHEKRLEELMEAYEKEISGAKALRKEIITKAKDEAGHLLQESNRVIENTIRQIREAQAEKEKTKDVRQKLEEFRENVVKNENQEETKTIGKAELLASKVQKIKRKRQPEKEKPVPVEQPLKAGDAVRMKDTQAAGEIIEIKDKMARIETGSLRFLVSLDKIERISRSELKKSLRSQQPEREEMASSVVPRNLNFYPEIDIRGMRGDEAIQKVQDLVDTAIVVRHRNLRILHGKGNGILRQLVRDYLSTVDLVKSYRDEHIEMGGTGITMVEMDV
ncbi:MAG TPA: Smr/MutS family protein [Bacteroidales bacterium]|nr:Smr/MutS family protein [Bacteroidales bacterium]